MHKGPRRRSYLWGTPNHLWLLQVLFLDPINADCDAFKAEWNAHPISTMTNCSPIVVSEHNEVHPDILRRYYAADGPIVQRRSHQTGAGHPSDEEESESESEVHSATDEPTDAEICEANDEREDEAGTGNETYHPLHEEIAQMCMQTSTIRQSEFYVL
ncbi:hypothetical protein JB92DRAFT_2830676 [Gautieria morchelliformis]|nr:hypothetical protein JB92DRAFT_2830676 [Gautieria morchelliformis]